MRLLKNGAVIDEHGQLIVRFVYADADLAQYLLQAVDAWHETGIPKILSARRAAELAETIDDLDLRGADLRDYIRRFLDETAPR